MLEQLCCRSVLVYGKTRKENVLQVLDLLDSDVNVNVFLAAEAVIMSAAN